MGACSPCPLYKGTPQPGTGHPSSSFACAVIQFLHKSTRRRKKQNNKRCPGPMPAVWHSSLSGRWGPPVPCSYTMARAGVPTPSAWHDAGLSAGYRSASAPAPGPPQGQHALRCRASTEPVLIPAAWGSSMLRSGHGHQGHAPCQHDPCLNSNALRMACSRTLNTTRFQATINSSRT